MKSIQIIAVPGIPEIEPGDDVAHSILDAIDRAPIELTEGDVLVVTHKIVSKGEGRVIDGDSDEAYRAAVEEEAQMVLRRRGDLTIAQTRHGFAVLVAAYRANINRRNLLGSAVGENPMFRAFRELHLGFLSPQDSFTMIHEIGSWKDIVG